MAEPLASTWIGKTTRLIRQLARDPEINAEIDAEEILELYIEPSTGQVLQSVSMSSENSVLGQFSLNIVANQQYYALPPHVRQVVTVGTMSDRGYQLFDLIPRSKRSPHGPVWQMNGPNLELRPMPTSSTYFSSDGTLDVWFYPSGDIRLHYGTATVHASNQRSVVLGASPTYGTLDTRSNAYAGTILRSRTAPLDSYVIESYDRATRTATLRTDVPAALLGQSMDYEILPPIGYHLWDLVAMQSALTILAFKDARSRYALVEREMAKRIKAVRDQYSNIQGRTPKRFETDTVHGADGVLAPFGWARNWQS